jgi:hypothetical protein
VLTSEDGRTLALPTDVAITAEHGLFLTGRCGRYRIRARASSGIVPCRMPRAAATAA